MAFRIQTSVKEDTITFTISGRLDIEGIAELTQLLEDQIDGHNLVLDLEDLGLVDRLVIRSLTAFETAGVRLINCPPYVRDWILRDAESA